MYLFSNIILSLKLKYAYVFLLQHLLFSATFYDLPLYLNAHAYTLCKMHAQSYILCKYMFPMFAGVKVLEKQNTFNVHHMHTLVCKVFKWN